jgi:hypothetical protein
MVPLRHFSGTVKIKTQICALNIVELQLPVKYIVAARLVSQKQKCDHILDALRYDLHWLPIHQRIIYNLALSTSASNLH